MQENVTHRVPAARFRVSNFSIFLEDLSCFFYTIYITKGGILSYEYTDQNHEDLSLNAWPSHQIELYDGWILRFSYFYTHRTNSVEQIGPSTIPVEEKVQYCEEIYRRWGTPAIFKISPLVNPGFDAMLADRGYVSSTRRTS